MINNADNHLKHMSLHARRYKILVLMSVSLVSLCAPLLTIANISPKGQSHSNPGTVSPFDSKVLPILQQRCLGCHGVDGHLANLDLRTKATALKGGTHGAAFKPGNSKDSLLYQLISGVRAPQMPPGGKLPAAEIAALKQWIDSGANYGPTQITTAAKQTWWSFKVPVLPKVPGLKSSWVKTPIDSFILDKLTESHLSTTKPASRRVLIRRAYFDLIGLPPSPAEVTAFEEDRSPKAWGKVVDRLLASPRYGERWARHWLDVVRYADSGGFEGDKDRLLAWRYRDYVIDSFNSDKPFDLFLKEQIAGDEYRPHDPEALVATGYLGLGCEDLAQVKSKRFRADEVDDIIATTCSSIFGLTVMCARCHDHKYDPIKQTDYYRLAAIFYPTIRKEIDIPSDEQKSVAAEQNALIDKRESAILEIFQPLKQKALSLVKTMGMSNPTDDQLASVLNEPERKQFKDLNAQIKAMDATRPPYPKAMVVTDVGSTFPEMKLHIRGDAEHPGAPVKPGFICSLPGGDRDIPESVARTETTGRRHEFAEWAASRKNPLTARVWVNRVWRQHFGRGLVNTPSNFGINGELPTHPELLDYLAVKFMDGGWKTKPLHKLILMSSVWQQSSEAQETSLRTDPQNKLLWRMPVRRLEAEAIRDSMLAVCGTLNLEMHGPPVYPPVDPSLRFDTFQGVNWPVGDDNPQTRRRSIYIKIKRSLIFPGLDVFDCPEITNSVAARNVTTTPLQTLMLLNDPLILKQATLFAERLERECGADKSAIVNRAYSIAFDRPPTKSELAMSVQYLNTHTRAEFCQAILNLNEFLYIE